MRRNDVTISLEHYCKSVIFDSLVNRKNNRKKNRNKKKNGKKKNKKNRKKYKMMMIMIMKKTLFKVI